MAKKNLWRLLQTRYRLILRNESKLADVAGSHVTIAGIVAWALAVALLFVGISFVIAVYTPLREYLPGYLNSEMRHNLATTSMRLDSLLREVERQRAYVTNIQDIFRGEVKADSVTSIDSLAIQRSEELAKSSEIQEEFARKFEESEKYNLTSQATAVSDIQGLSLYIPVRGDIITPFDPEAGHYGVDIAARSNAEVLNILDGTVLFSDYTSADKNVVIVQHTQDITSIYKNCTLLRKSAGDKVLAGEAIARLGDAQESEQNNRLHFELWYKGRPLDPNLYIDF